MKSTKITYELVVDSSLHIGSGEQLNRLDSFKENQTIYILDENKVLKLLKDKNLVDAFAKYVSLESKNADIGLFMQEKRIVKELKEKCVKSQFVHNDSPKNINLCVKDIYGKPYIPGSTIKGVVVSSLIDYRLAKMEGYSKNLTKKDDLFQLVFGEDFKRVLSNISVSDSTSVDMNNVEIVKKMGVNSITSKPEGTGGNGLNIYRECLKKDSKVEFTINLIGDDFSKEEIEKAIKYRTYKIIGSKGVIGMPYVNLKRLIPIEIKRAEIPLILGGGAGFHSKVNLMGIHKDVLVANGKAKSSLDRKFSRYKAKSHEVTSPRIIKLNTKGMIMGACHLNEVYVKELV